MSNRSGADATPSEADARELDDESLLAALTLAPGVYSRNRMFHLYERNGRAKLLRGRANRLRGVARMWLERPDATMSIRGRDVDLELVLEVPSMAYRRTLVITEFERGLLALLVEKATSNEPTRSVELALGTDDKSRVQSALARLSAA